MLQQVIYVSRMTKSADVAKTLENILQSARKNNAKLSVTGLLVHDNESFLQVLEGEEKILDTLYAVIERDKRHDQIKLLLRQDIEEKEFGEWSMASANITLNESLLEGLIDLKDFNIKNLDSQMAKSVLKKFFQGAWQS